MEHKAILCVCVRACVYKDCCVAAYAVQCVIFFHAENRQQAQDEQRVLLERYVAAFVSLLLKMRNKFSACVLECAVCDTMTGKVKIANIHPAEVHQEGPKGK